MTAPSYLPIAIARSIRMSNIDAYRFLKHSIIQRFQYKGSIISWKLILNVTYGMAMLFLGINHFHLTDPFCIPCNPVRLISSETGNLDTICESSSGYSHLLQTEYRKLVYPGEKNRLSFYFLDERISPHISDIHDGIWKG